MKKTFSIIVFFTSLYIYFAYSEDFGDYLAVESTPYYSWGEQMGVLEKGEIVSLNGTVTDGPLGSQDAYTLNVVFKKENKLYVTYAKSIVPVNAEMLFLTDILSVENKNIFLPAYYCSVLVNNNPEIILENEPGLSISFFDGERDVLWHENYTDSRGACRFYNSVVRLRSYIYSLGVNTPPLGAVENG
jgi:hypothetical protein